MKKNQVDLDKAFEQFKQSEEYKNNPTATGGLHDSVGFSIGRRGKVGKGEPANEPETIKHAYTGKAGKLADTHPYIVAWGQLMGSYGYYIERQVMQARVDGAPKNATFYSDSDKAWRTTDGMRTDLKWELDQYLAGTKGGVIVHW